MEYLNGDEKGSIHFWVGGETVIDYVVVDERIRSQIKRMEVRRER